MGEWAFEQDIEEGVEVCQMERSRTWAKTQRHAKLAFSKAGIEKAE